jgi:hypothetical protein
MASGFVATTKAAKLMQLERLAGKLSATARELSSVADRQNAYLEIAGFRDRIAALKANDSTEEVIMLVKAKLK